VGRESRARGGEIILEKDRFFALWIDTILKRLDRLDLKPRHLTSRLCARRRRPDQVELAAGPITVKLSDPLSFSLQSCLFLLVVRSKKQVLVITPAIYAGRELQYGFTLVF